MSGAEVLDIGRDAIWLTIQLSAPALVVGLIVGVAIGLMQALTQIQEATLVYAPKIVAIFLSLMAAVLIFVTDLHHFFIGAMVRSYSLFPFGHAPPVADFGQLMIRTTAGAFALGVQLAAPVLVFSLVFNIATGLVGRAMPQFQIFFAAAPLQLLLGMSLLALSLGAMGTFWIDRYRGLLSAFG